MQCKLKAKIIEMNDNLNDTIKNFERIFISAYRKNDHITQNAAFIVLRDFYLYTPLFLVYISSSKNVYCHGEVVSVPATRSPIPGSYLGHQPLLLVHLTCTVF